MGRPTAPRPPAGVRAGAEPFRAEGGRVGALVCHGFTGSPASVRPWAEHLAAHGLTVDVPLLPGHGTDWRDLHLTAWTDWAWAVERSFAWLQERCDTVVAMGLSMGGALVTHLAAQHPAGTDGRPGVAGLVLVNPSLTGDTPALHLVPYLKHVVRSIRSIGNDIARPGYDELAYERVPVPAIDSLRGLWRTVQRELPSVRQPVLVMRSKVDRIVGPASVALLQREIGSEDVTVRTLHRSHHVATLDHDAGLIQRESLAFALRLAGQTAPAGPSVDAASEPPA